VIHKVFTLLKLHNLPHAILVLKFHREREGLTVNDFFKIILGVLLSIVAGVNVPVWAMAEMVSTMPIPRNISLERLN